MLVAVPFIFVLLQVLCDVCPSLPLIYSVRLVPPLSPKRTRTLLSAVIMFRRSHQNAWSCICYGPETTAAIAQAVLMDDMMADLQNKWA